MCKASMGAVSTRDAEVQDDLTLGLSKHGLPAFHRPGDEAGHMTCIKDGQVLAFANIPPDVQDKLGILSETTAAFVEYRDDVPDGVHPLGGEIVSLSEFLPEDIMFGEDCGIIVTVGGKPDEGDIDNGSVTAEPAALIDA